MIESRSRRRVGRHHVHVGRPPEAERETRRSARREALLDAAVAAVEAHGDRVTMTAMAAEAGVTKPVLYRYFGDRAGLYEALAARFAAGLLDRLRPELDGGVAGRHAVEASVEAYLCYVESHRALYRFLVWRLPTTSPDGQGLVRGFVHRVAAEISDALGPALRAAGVPAANVELVAFGVTGTVQLAGEVWLERGSMPRRQAVAQLSELLWRGLASVGDAAGADIDVPPRRGLPTAQVPGG